MSPSTCVGGAHACKMPDTSTHLELFFLWGVKIIVNRRKQNKSKTPRLGDKRRPRVNDPTIDALPSAGSQTQKTSSSVLVNLAARTAGLHTTDAGFTKSPRHALLRRVILINPSTRAFSPIYRVCAKFLRTVFPLKTREIGSRASSGGVSDVFGGGGEACVPYPGRSGRSELSWCSVG